MVARVSALAVALAATGLAGCRVFDESLLDAGGTDGGRDAGPDAAFDGGVDAATDAAAPACPLRHPPVRPAVPDTPGGEQVVFAFKDIYIDQGDGWSTIGYDLDGLCSVGDEPDVECYPPAASSTPEIDGEGGIDNVLGHEILPLTLVAVPDLATAAVRDQDLGIGALILVVHEWSGEEDDPDVRAVLTQSVYGTPGLPDGGPPVVEIPDGGLSYDDGGVPPLPEWEGNDWWWVRTETFLGGDLERPMLEDDAAYVAGGTLVMRLPDRVPIILSGTERAAIFKLTGAVLTVHFAEDRRHADAVLAGRWPVADILVEIEHANICRDTEDYATFARLLDLAADIRATPGTGGAGAICDAVSVGMTLRGTRAHFGGLSDLFEIPTPCADAGASDAGLDGG